MEEKKTLHFKRPLPAKTIDNQTNSYRSDYSNLEENEEEHKPKEKYSTFLIRMLDEEPKSRRRIKNQMSKLIKTNNNFIKTKIKYNPYKTNYSSRSKNISIPTENNLNNNKKFSIKENYFSNISLYNNRKKSKMKANSNSYGSNIFSSTQFNIYNNNAFKLSNIIYKNMIKNTEPRVDSNLVTKTTFLNNNSLDKSGNKNNSIEKDLNKKRLNTLYGYDQNFIRSKSYLRRKKYTLNLDKYQDDILKISQRNLCKDHLYKLYSDLQSIKNNANMVRPLPPINYAALILHSCNEDNKLRRKLKSKKNFENKKLKEMDDYEKELYEIKKSNELKREKFVRNNRMYKIYEILPEHVIDALYKKKKKFFK
jgi:hypothetical protein